jgi:hypothetical protein
MDERIRPIPVTYNGTTYRSALEADWAATFAALGWYYEYEPTGVEFADGTRYLCDFHLPAQNVWCEVKGHHNLGLTKAHRLHRAVGEDRPGGTLVVVLRPAGPGGYANWHHATGHRTHVSINQCGNCREWVFNVPIVEHQECRSCHNPEGLIWAFGKDSRIYIPAARYEAKRIEINANSDGSCDGDSYLKEIYGDHGRLSFVRAPRSGRAA